MTILQTPMHSECLSTVTDCPNVTKVKSWHSSMVGKREWQRLSKMGVLRADAAMTLEDARVRKSWYVSWLADGITKERDRKNVRELCSDTEN